MRRRCAVEETGASACSEESGILRFKSPDLSEQSRSWGPPHVAPSRCYRKVTRLLCRPSSSGLPSPSISLLGRHYTAPRIDVLGQRRCPEVGLRV
jgi:hypothetical protein